MVVGGIECSHDLFHNKVLVEYRGQAVELPADPDQSSGPFDTEGQQDEASLRTDEGTQRPPRRTVLLVRGERLEEPLDQRLGWLPRRTV